MYGSKDAPPVPRNGHMLVAGIIARISGCANQKEVSLEDQLDHGKEVIADMYDGSVDYRIISTTGKGERLDRPELEQIEAALLSEELDLLVMEDMGRLVRGIEACRLFGVGVDHGTRCISPNDAVDTIEPTWEEDALAACRDHVAHNAHTSKRIKQKLMNRFVKSGAAMARPIAGYILPADAETYNDWLKDGDATPIIRQGLKRLEQSRNGETVAEYFNTVPHKGGIGFPPGPYCRRKMRDGTIKKTTRWNGKMVRRFYKNRTLGGAPGRGFKHSVKIHESGRRVAVTNPDGPRFIECPHLAHVDLAELDSVNAVLKQANARLGRQKINGFDPLFRVSRKDTRFPAPNAACWYCGHHHVWGGNGITGNLMCSASRDWLCWNSIGYSGELAVERVMQLLTAELYKLDGFDEQYRDLIRLADQDAGMGQDQRRAKLHEDEAALAQQRQNVQAAIAEFGPKPMVRQMLEALEARERELAFERANLKRLESRSVKLPQSVAELRRMFEDQFRVLAADSREFGRLLRQVVPNFHVYLVRLCDGGHPLPRAKVSLALDGIVPDAGQVSGLAQLLTFERTIDLFVPPQRERIREQAVRLASEGLGPKEIAKKIVDQAPGLDHEQPTATAVQNALSLDRKMKGLGLTSPYITLMQPPEDYPKLRRHQNSKYRFTPLDGYAPPAI